MQLITDEYRELNQQLHKKNIHYGVGGHKYLHDIINIAKDLKTQDILDYGCGKCYLADNLPFAIKKYDPAIEKYSDLPEPAEIVVCTEVLEHIEPELIENVLNHLKELIKKIGFFTICFRPAKKELPDGRNAHLIQKKGEWWLKKLIERFEIAFYQSNGLDCVVVVRALEQTNDEQKT
jgi:hypothetical protein